ncbi:hypothetical protein M422DRAFT_265350 [Sphaerobolus stellatus SS14]|uniref:Uncharacterized protein n=1 Tax=Sphaerobolus stellatus (strain SS14) TaxID=990650 RepID=A0A0C9V5U9_SPHS4|nr:hypothetical protein M422DRAFT_265350 [Sphaerobolus stellatus SS14]
MDNSNCNEMANSNSSACSGVAQPPLLPQQFPALGVHGCGAADQLGDGRFSHEEGDNNSRHAVSQLADGRHTTGSTSEDRSRHNNSRRAGSQLANGRHTTGSTREDRSRHTTGSTSEDRSRVIFVDSQGNELGVYPSTGLSNSRPPEIPSACTIFRQAVPLPAELPPISLLFQAVDRSIGTVGQWEDEDVNPFHVWSIALAAVTAEEPYNRDPLSLAAHLSGHDIIPPEDFSSIDRNCRVKHSVLTAYIRWLKQYINGHAITRALPMYLRPKVWILDADVFHLPGDTVGHLLTTSQGGRNSTVLDMDAWLIPMWASKRKVWVLGVLDLCRRRYWYVDSQPTFSRDLAAQGQEWVWQHLSRSYSMITQYLGLQRITGNWNGATATHSNRATTGVDSGIWVAADIEAWVLGHTHAPEDLDISRYRLRMRHHIMHLPEVTSTTVIPHVPHLSPEQWGDFEVWQLERNDLSRYSRDYKEECGTWQRVRLPYEPL